MSEQADILKGTGHEDIIAALVAIVSRYLVDAGITEGDEVSIREAAINIARIVGGPGAGSRGGEGTSGSRPVDTTELPKGWLTPEEDALVPPRRLWLGPSDPISHYYRWVWEYLAYLTLLCDLRRESAVLELGCGHGRTARGLLDCLRHPGHYRGLDVDRVRIEDAQARLQTKCPHFEFVWADVYNSQYNPQGQAKAESYVLPFADGAFDVVYAASLFTHLLPSETLNYFSQSRRVLKRDGKCLFSMFVLDYYRGPGTTISPYYEFPHRYAGHQGVAVRDPGHPDNLIGYKIGAIESFAKRAGLNVLRVIPGLWSESPGLAVNEQDLVLLSRND
jgi:SAM-dependent methyltransferase